MPAGERGPSRTEVDLLSLSPCGPTSDAARAGHWCRCAGWRHRIRFRPPMRYLADVSDYVIPEPEPKEIDEKLSIELRHLADNAVLRAQPSGDEKCENCRYYLEPYKELSYCWHQKLRILVGSEWWCQWWDAIPEE